MKSRVWSDDELVVLAVIFLRADFSIGDDARGECMTIADCFGRTPSAVDRQWRNMSAAIDGKAGVNMGRLVRDTVRKVAANPAGYQELALHICESHGWPLEDLVRDGALRAANRPKTADRDPAAIECFAQCCDELEFTLFPSGAQGFVLDKSVAVADDVFTLRVSAVARGSHRGSNIMISTRIPDIAASVRNVVRTVPAIEFPSGRIGYSGSMATEIDDICYDVTIRAQQRT